MKKVLTLILAMVMVFSLAACGASGSTGASSSAAASGSAGSTSASGDKKVIKVSFGLAAQSAEAAGAAKFEELIEAKYPEFDVQCYSDAQLGDDTTATQNVAMGNLECVITSTSPLTGMCKDLEVFDLPFLFPNYDAADAVLNGEIGDAIAAKLQSNGLRNLAWFENGFRDLTNSKLDVHAPADVKGLKIRTMENPIHLAIWKALGAAPTPMAFSEVFTALQQGAIDGQENPISTIYLNKFYEVNKYVTLTHHVYSPKNFLMNEALFESLTKEQQDYFLQSAQEAAKVNKEQNRQQCTDYIKNLTDAGATVTELTTDEHNAFVDATSSVYDQFSSEIGADLIKQVQDVCSQYLK